MHRWAASVEMPTEKGTGKAFLGADGTKFKRQPGEKGEVRLVVEMGEDGEVRPLGVWAGSSWEEIGKEVKRRLGGRPELLMTDGERAMEKWLGRLTKRVGRCQWHFVRDSGYVLWEKGVPLEERKEMKKRLGQLLAIEIPEKDMETVSEPEKQELRERILGAEGELLTLEKEFEGKGYEEAATYLGRARERLFTHLWLWLETGIVAPRTASVVENIIRELVRRLKKVGWNWSDAGATRMGRIVMIRRYDEGAWEEYWQKRMNLQGRCRIEILSCEVRRVA